MRNQSPIRPAVPSGSACHIDSQVVIIGAGETAIISHADDPNSERIVQASYEIAEGGLQFLDASSVVDTPNSSREAYLYDERIDGSYFWYNDSLHGLANQYVQIDLTGRTLDVVEIIDSSNSGYAVYSPVEVAVEHSTNGGLTWDVLATVDYGFEASSVHAITIPNPPTGGLARVRATQAQPGSTSSQRFWVIGEMRAFDNTAATITRKVAKAGQEVDYHTGQPNETRVTNLQDHAVEYTVNIQICDS